MSDKEEFSKDSIQDIYGKNVFSMKNMRDFLSEKAYKSLINTVREGKPISAGISDEVADAMKNWAVSNGATHFTHWFLPLTGTTAEKHDSFIYPDKEGGVIMNFSGTELIQGEPDASSLPSGGLRATFEARGYTAWDPSSPAFIKRSKRGATLCIPTAFYSYNGEALDKKTPLLRSINFLSKQVKRLSGIFNIKGDGRIYTTLGAEQEYFLIDRKYYNDRIDLLQTSRTLFGREPAKHQQMNDHYFGAIKSRVVDFMDDLDRAMWELGIPAKTRHNEVCPGQFEIVPVYEELNLAVDHNMLTMELLHQVAGRHGLKCLLHEKPFAGVNGSGKHNNWALVGPDGKNWLNPGKTPHENLKFITVIIALMTGIDKYAGLLRASVSTAGNDRRLGGYEAPPAIMSIFLGGQLTDIINQIENGSLESSKERGIFNSETHSMPELMKDVTDRNRTSPFAFTGDKFEFRTVGSNQNCADPCTAINMILADSLEGICDDIKSRLKGKDKFDEILIDIFQEKIKKHKRVLFDGDNYSDDWKKEAKKRGLPDYKSTAEALEVNKEPEVIELFKKTGVLSPRELEARYEIYKEQYEMTIRIEAEVALDMTRTIILPEILNYQNKLAATVNNVAEAGNSAENAKKLLSYISELSEKVSRSIISLKSSVEKGDTFNIKENMDNLRKPVDELEGLLPKNIWPLPSYAEMLFKM
ncbi:MAG: glutamine synthetase III [Elusimicrobia bacterium]|jgi:glutamine synthetase|nr:glutamine synthetase III [Elusimicrobiota bacterium]